MTTNDATASGLPGWVKPAIIAVCLAGAGLLIARNLGGDARVADQRWAYDLNADRIFAVDAQSPTPLDTDSGTFDYPGLGPAGAGVHAYIASCGDCSALSEGMSAAEVDAAGLSFEAVTRLDGPTAARARAEGLGGAGLALEGSITATRDGQQWIPDNNAKASELRPGSVNRCPDGRFPVLCIP